MAFWAIRAAFVAQLFGGYAWRIRLTKNSSSKPDTQMDKVTIQLLSADEKSAIKSFFCMYLIRPDVSLVSASFAPLFVHLEGCFESPISRRMYDMSSKKGENLKNFLVF
jgi:hypothetical protein